MSKFYIAVFLFINVVSVGISQNSLNDYSYVVVSEQFEFQKEKDKYELNSFAKFLFNKHGFHAFFDREVPKNVSRCDGLWAEAEGGPGFIYSKVTLVLRDCNGDEVFRTQKGTSKIKDYKKAYYESMRGAFNSFITLGVHQKEIEKGLIKQSVAETPSAKISKEVAIVKTSPGKDKVVVPQLNLPLEKYTNYNYSGDSYLLRKSNKGYSFYKESKNQEEDMLLVGKLVVLNNEIEFVDSKNKVSKAYFTNSKNLIIEKDDKIIQYKVED